MTPAKHNWRPDAECADLDTEIFFPEEYTEESTELAQAICDMCRFKEQCLSDALEHDYSRDHGIWAGTTPAERKKMKVKTKYTGRERD